MKNFFYLQTQQLIAALKTLNKSVVSQFIFNVWKLIDQDCKIIIDPNIEIHLSEPNPSWEGKRRQNLPHPLSTTPPPPFSTPPVQCARTCGCVMRGCNCFTCVCVLTSVVCVWFGPTSSLLFHNPHHVGPQEFGLWVLVYACIWDVLYYSFPNACVCGWARGCTSTWHNPLTTCKIPSAD